MKRPRRTRTETLAADAWQSFWTSPNGRIAIAALFRDFGFYDTPMGDRDALIRSIGQRDVLVRISQLINLKPEQAPDDDRDTSDLLDRMMRT
jgi:hypothetical protein